MLTISFATRTDSTDDPLVERALELAMDFMDLTGLYFIDRYQPSVSHCICSILRALV